MKKYFFYLILIIGSFMIYNQNVNAQVVSSPYNNYFNTFLTSTGEDISVGINSTGQNAFRNKGQGYLIFSFYYANDSSNGELPYSVMANSHLCDIGSTVYYNDNIHQRATITAKCPVNFTGSGAGSTWTTITIDTKGLGTRYFLFSQFASFYDFNNGSGSSAIDLTTIESQLTGIYNRLDGIGSDFYTLQSSNYNLINVHLVDIYNALNGTNVTIADIKNNTEQIKNDIKNENVSGAEGSADDLKNNSAFQDNSGLSSIISMPLTFVNSLTNTCQPINLTIPYMDADVSIPCMQSVITNKMPLLANLIKIVINGFIVYRILLDIFQIVRNAKNPEDDRIEVLDL